MGEDAPEATAGEGRGWPQREACRPGVDAARTGRVFFAMATIFEKIIAGEIPATIVHKDDASPPFATSARRRRCTCSSSLTSRSRPPTT